MNTSADLFPHYLKARSPRGLSRLMGLNNTKLGMQAKYFNIQFVEGSWYAWYYADSIQVLEAENKKTPTVNMETD